MQAAHRVSSSCGASLRARSSPPALLNSLQAVGETAHAGPDTQQAGSKPAGRPAANERQIERRRQQHRAARRRASSWRQRRRLPLGLQPPANPPVVQGADLVALLPRPRLHGCALQLPPLLWKVVHEARHLGFLQHNMSREQQQLMGLLAAAATQRRQLCRPCCDRRLTGRPCMPHPPTPCCRGCRGC